jgi:hypothetical protein
MAPNLAKSQHDLISNVISSELHDPEIAEAAGCSTRFVRAIHANIRYFGTPKAPQNGNGRKRSITLATILDWLGYLSSFLSRRL